MVFNKKKMTVISTEIVKIKLQGPPVLSTLTSDEILTLHVSACQMLS